MEVKFKEEVKNRQESKASQYLEEVQKKAKEAELKKTELMYTIPPDLNLCNIHRQAQFMKKQKTDNPTEDDICHCCGNVYTTDVYPLCEDPEMFSLYGFGVTAYFRLMKYSTYICTILIPIGIIIMLFYLFGGTNKGENKLSKKYNNDDPGINSSFSIGNVYEDSVILAGFLNIIAIIILYLSWVQFMRKITDDAIILDIDNLTPSDYTLELKRLPTTFNDDNLIDTVFGPDKVERVCFSYNISDIVKLSRNLNLLKVHKKIIEKIRTEYKRQFPDYTDTEINNAAAANYPTSGFLCFKKKFKDYDVICEELTENEQRLETMKWIQKSGLDRANYGYITFKTPEIAEKELRRYKSTFWERVRRKGKMQYMDSNIIVKKAPEPEEICWENLHITFKAKFIRVFITCFVTCALLIGCFLILLLLQNYSYSLRGDDSFLSTFLIAVCSLTQISINFILCIVIAIFARQEGLSTQTDFHVSIGIKLTIAMFINTAILPVLVITSEEEFFQNSGLVDMIVFTWISLAFFQPIFELISPMFFFNIYRRWVIKKAGAKCYRTQMEANINFEPQKLNMSKKYAEMAVLLLYTAFYLPLFPGGIIISVMGYIVNYWVDKYLMLRRYKHPERINSSISKFFMVMCAFSVPLYGFSNGYFMSRLGDKGATYYMEAGFLLSFLIVKYLLSKVNKKQRSGCIYHVLSICNTSLGLTEFQQNYQLDYDPMKFGRRDYMFINPVTRTDAEEKNLHHQLGVAKTENEKEVLAGQLASLARKSHLGESLYNYGRRTTRGGGVLPMEPVQNNYNQGWQYNYNYDNYNMMNNYNNDPLPYSQYPPLPQFEQGYNVGTGTPIAATVNYCHPNWYGVEQGHQHAYNEYNIEGTTPQSNTGLVMNSSPQHYNERQTAALNEEYGVNAAVPSRSRDHSILGNTGTPAHMHSYYTQNQGHSQNTQNFLIAPVEQLGPSKFQGEADYVDPEDIIITEKAEKGKLPY